MFLVFMFLWTRILTFALQLKVSILPEMICKVPLSPKYPLWIINVFLFEDRAKEYPGLWYRQWKIYVQDEYEY